MTAPAGKWTKVRILICGLALGAGLAAMARRAYRLQVGEESERLRAMAEEQYLREIELPPKRGRILDRNGAELASTADVDSIYCNPRQLPDVNDAATRMAKLLGLDRKELAQKLRQRRYFAWVKRRVTPEEAQAVKDLGLPGVAFAREPRRFYPNRALAATVMGHSGSDGRGLDGVELALDRQLRGQGSSLQGVRDALGRDLIVAGTGDATGDAVTGAGGDVVLTIDRYLTFVTERAIAEAQVRHRAKAVVAVMMDPRNGDVLAMASVPSYNPNDPGSAAASGARNRAITDTFEPGSTMKTFTIAAALDAGAVRPDDRLDCQMGKMQVGKHIIHDTHPHGMLTVAEVFKQSSNIGATKIARRLGRDRLADALARFGFGRPTGVGLPGERGGVVRPPDRWGDIGFSNLSFGHGMTATPLQILSGVTTVAAGGVRHAPRVLLRTVKPDGTVEPAGGPPATRVIGERPARQMIEIMKGVTEPGGTAKAAAIEGYSVAGKTGTAQKASGGRYDPGKWMSSFVGFVPADDPRVAIVVIVDEPEGGHLGGAVAAPVWKEIAEQALRYLHVPPSPALLAKAKGKDKDKDKGRAHEPDRQREPRPGADGDTEERPTSDVTVAMEEDQEAGLGGGSGDANELGGSADGDGDGEREDEGQGDEGAPDRLVTVPDFTGLSLAAAIRTARRNGVELALDDGAPASGVALAQQPAPGLAPMGTRCQLTFGRLP
jgi:cell division protein FtsI (penicillin-binding protein 3)